MLKQQKNRNKRLYAIKHIRDFFLKPKGLYELTFCANRRFDANEENFQPSETLLSHFVRKKLQNDVKFYESKHESVLHGQQAQNEQENLKDVDALKYLQVFVDKEYKVEHAIKCVEIMQDFNIHAHRLKPLVNAIFKKNHPGVPIPSIPSENTLRVFLNSFNAIFHRNIQITLLHDSPPVNIAIDGVSPHYHSGGHVYSCRMTLYDEKNDAMFNCSLEFKKLPNEHKETGKMICKMLKDHVLDNFAFLSVDTGSPAIKSWELFTETEEGGLVFCVKVLSGQCDF